MRMMFCGIYLIYYIICDEYVLLKEVRIRSIFVCVVDY